MLSHGVTFNEIVVSIEIVPLIYTVTRLTPPPATPHKPEDKNFKINVRGMGCSCLETTNKVEPEVIQFIWIVII